jgi:transposase
MIGLPRGLSCFAHRAPVDMRKSFNTLGALVSEGMKRDVLCGELYVFVSKDRKRAKVLYFDGTGLCLFSKRLEKGHFSAPWKRHGQGDWELTLSELALFIEGSESVARGDLSPPLLKRVELTRNGR